MSFHEKSLWLTSIALLAFAGLYFGTTLPQWSGDVTPQDMTKFIGALILMVLIQITGHVAIAIRDRRFTTDERDWLIELKGRRNGNHVLAVGVAMSLLAALVTKGNFLFTHLLLAFWVVSQLTESVSQIVLHRRGA